MTVITPSRIKSQKAGSLSVLAGPQATLGTLAALEAFILQDPHTHSRYSCILKCSQDIPIVFGVYHYAYHTEGPLAVPQGQPVSMVTCKFQYSLA
jgi:hypothetical protein